LVFGVQSRDSVTVAVAGRGVTVGGGVGAAAAEPAAGEAVGSSADVAEGVADEAAEQPLARIAATATRDPNRRELIDMMAATPRTKR
jgi:hypothetical protein